jgi:hypothetical protein
MGRQVLVFVERGEALRPLGGGGGGGGGYGGAGGYGLGPNLAKRGTIMQGIAEERDNLKVRAPHTYGLRPGMAADGQLTGRSVICQELERELGSLQSEYDRLKAEQQNALSVYSRTVRYRTRTDGD